MREDLKLTGRTLFGAMPPKGQELDDHYFGTIKNACLGIYERTGRRTFGNSAFSQKPSTTRLRRHSTNLRPFFSTTNIATDHNQLTMEIMKKVAERHGLVCLLHEKPFDGVNGSGKHNNWSLSVKDGANLFGAGQTSV
ncbi:MAG: hypothetical protein L6V93_02685 [Clostridiales bacterium]|nr:MAG: hypothetical protein L6V93_02685 [Clostridiales bacterium]